MSIAKENLNTYLCIIVKFINLLSIKFFNGKSMKKVQR